MARPHIGRKALRLRVCVAVAALVLALWAALLMSVHDSAASLGDDPDPRTARSAPAGGARVSPAPAPTMPSQWSNASHLIIVAGHTVFMGADLAGPSAETERDWYLLDYQRGQLGWFIDHIKRGVAKAAEDPQSLLIFSGGASRLSAGPRTEGSSYWLFADAHHWYTKSEAVAADIKRRAHTEEFARDSYENLAFSVCRFRQLAGIYPRHITLVSLPFKEHRFREVHLKALRFPSDRFTFLGVGGTSASAEQGERANSLDPYSKDPYGCRGSLAAKRLERDPFRRAEPYPKGCPEMLGLLSACSADIYSGSLPWDPR